MPVRASVRPQILEWGRATAGLSIEEAAQLLAVKPEQVSQWESGEAQPTMGQVRKMADKYRRPLNVFFLQAPPAGSGEPALPDFRSGGDLVPHDHSRFLRVALRTANEWRMDALDLYRAIESPVPQFTLRVNRTNGVEHAAETIRNWLGVTIDQQLGWPGYDRYRALREWRDSIEGKGVLVFQFGRIETSEMRGSSIFAEQLPVIVLNTSDTPNGRIFSLMHELAHLALRSSGLCDIRYVHPASIHNAVEVFCNAVAGTLLVPTATLMDFPDVAQATANTQWSEGRIQQLAANFKVSRLVILRRLLVLGKTNDAAYNARHLIWSSAGPDGEGGGDGRRIALNSRGQLLTKLVIAAYGARKITLFDTARRLGLKADSISYAREYIRG